MRRQAIANECLQTRRLMTAFTLPAYKHRADETESAKCVTQPPCAVIHSALQSEKVASNAILCIYCFYYSCSHSVWFLLQILHLMVFLLFCFMIL